MRNAVADGMSRLPRADSINNEPAEDNIGNSDNIKIETSDPNSTRIGIANLIGDPDNKRVDPLEVLKAFSFSVNTDVSDQPLVHCLTSSTIVINEGLIPEEVLNATSLTTQDRVKAKSEDDYTAEVK